MDHLLNSVGISVYAFTCMDERFSNCYISTFYNTYEIYRGNSSKELLKFVKNKKNVGIIVEEYINLFDHHLKKRIFSNKDKNIKFITEYVDKNNLNLIFKVQGMTNRPLQLISKTLIYNANYIGYIENKTLHSKKDRKIDPKDYDIGNYVKIEERKKKLERINSYEN